jgi:hypothetical protein
MSEVNRVCENLRGMIKAMEAYQLELERGPRIDVVYKLVDAHIYDGIHFLHQIELEQYAYNYGMIGLLREVVWYGLQSYEMYVEQDLEGNRKRILQGGMDEHLQNIEDATNEAAALLKSIDPTAGILQDCLVMNRNSLIEMDKAKAVAFGMLSHHRLGPGSIESNDRNEAFHSSNVNPDIMRQIMQVVDEKSKQLAEAGGH